MNPRSFMLASCAAFALAGCESTPAPEAPDFRPDPGSFASGQYSRITDERFVYVEEEDAFERLWREHAGTDTRPPKLDFERHAVIALFAGQKPTGGHAIETRYMEQRGDTLHFEVRLLAPGAGCMTTQALTQPWQLIRAPRGAERVEFAVERRRMPCR